MSATPASPEEAPSRRPRPSPGRKKSSIFTRARRSPPGTGSVFGRGFFRRFFSMSATASLVFPALLAIGAGVFLFGLAGTVGPYEEGLRASYSPRIFPYAMGIGASSSCSCCARSRWRSTGTGREPRASSREGAEGALDLGLSLEHELDAAGGEHVDDSPLGG